jgi:anti-sigma factor RsiW
MVLFDFRYHYCRRRMVAYLNGELSPAARRRMARFIDECPACYAEYRRQRGLHEHLTVSLPPFGTPSQPQLDRMWTGIQQEMHRSRSISWWQYSTRYGVLACLVALIFMLPVVVLPAALEYTGVPQALPTQPAPQLPVALVTVTEAPVQQTPAPLATQAVALTTDEVNVMIPAAAPQWTPLGEQRLGNGTDD